MILNASLFLNNWGSIYFTKGLTFQTVRQIAPPSVRIYYYSITVR